MLAGSGGGRAAATPVGSTLRRSVSGAGFLARLITDRAARRSVWLRWRRPTNLFQPFNDTAEDRYPEVFELLSERLRGLDSPRILSFGCSTGAEVFSLRRALPTARIVGVDISKGNIAECLRRLGAAPDPGIAFQVAADGSGFASESLDSVLCMAVFRHGDLSAPDLVRCDHLIRFEDFERTLAQLDRALVPGGILVVEHANFRLGDTAMADRYRCVLSFERSYHPRTRIFDREDRLIPGASYGDVVFEKANPAAR